MPMPRRVLTKGFNTEDFGGLHTYYYHSVGQKNELTNIDSFATNDISIEAS